MKYIKLNWNNFLISLLIHLVIINTVSAIGWLKLGKDNKNSEENATVIKSEQSKGGHTNEILSKKRKSSSKTLSLDIGLGDPSVAAKIQNMEGARTVIGHQIDASVSDIVDSNKPGADLKKLIKNAKPSSDLKPGDEITMKPKGSASTKSVINTKTGKENIEIKKESKINISKTLMNDGSEEKNRIQPGVARVPSGGFGPSGPSGPSGPGAQPIKSGPFGPSGPSGASGPGEPPSRFGSGARPLKSGPFGPGRPSGHFVPGGPPSAFGPGAKPIKSGPFGSGRPSGPFVPGGHPSAFGPGAQPIKSGPFGPGEPYGPSGPGGPPSAFGPGARPLKSGPFGPGRPSGPFVPGVHPSAFGPGAQPIKSGPFVPGGSSGHFVPGGPAGPFGPGGQPDAEPSPSRVLPKLGTIGANAIKSVIDLRRRAFHSKDGQPGPQPNHPGGLSADINFQLGSVSIRPIPSLGALHDHVLPKLRPISDHGIKNAIELGKHAIHVPINFGKDRIANYKPSIPSNALSKSIKGMSAGGGNTQLKYESN